jgi:hypothetical protein
MSYQQLIIYFFVLLVSFATALTVPAAEEILNNASVIDLQSLNLGGAVIIEKIKTSKCDFDTSIDRKAVREFDSEKIADGIYKITPTTDLNDGEYAFCPAISRGYGRFFTFGIQGK